MSRWLPESTADGSWTLRDRELDQACHSSSGAWSEARERYAIPCRLAELARERDVVRVLDVGTGPGWNVAAALEATRSGGARLEVVSLERDREVFEQGAVCARSGPGVEWLAPARAALAESLDRGGAPAPWPDGRPGGARLVLGDARATLPELDAELAFDAVLLDPFSPASAPELWEPEFLAEVARRMAEGARLSTYTVSLAVRAALASAGLAVGRGPGFGAKREGTLAARGAEVPPFDARVARKLARRVARVAADASPVRDPDPAPESAHER